MSFITSVIAASEGAQTINELPLPAPVFGVIAFVALGALGLVTWSFRDVANRHAEKAEAYAREHGNDHH